MRRRLVAGAVAVLAASVGVGALAPSADAAPTVDIRVNAGTSLGTVPSSGVGLNTGFGDDHMGTPKVTSLMKAAGVRQLRYPGGSGADEYHWKTHTYGDGKGWIPSNTDFDHFMATAKKVGAQPILTANYGSGTPQEAADWVKYSNVDKGYGVKYWEIGNEVYGNGHYGNGKGWETDHHADKSPKEYGKNLVAYSKAMKAVDPKVKIGAVLTTPGFWPDAEKAPGDTADWNNTVLSIAGGSIDFVIVHWYPGGKTTADLLNTPSRIAGVRSSLRSLIAKYTGSRAASVEIAVTENGAVGSPAQTSQAAALFAPDTYMTWFEQGATHVDWWNLHNGTDQAPTTVHGQTDYQDGVCSPPAPAPGEVRTDARHALPHLLGHPLADRTGEAWRHHGQVVLGQLVGHCARGAEQHRRAERHADQQEPTERGAGVALVRRIHPGRRGGHDRFVCPGRHRPDDGEAGHGGRTDAAAVLDHDPSAEAQVGDRRR